MREQEEAKENVVALAQEIDGVVRILEGRSVAKQWIRRSVFEKRIAGLQRRGQRVKAQNATLCWWLRPELRALGASIRKLKKAATEAHRRAANDRHVERRLRNADADPVLRRLHPAQRRAVVVAEDTQLVLAGAGTGKTQTMAAKVADTLRHGRTTPEHVAVVTFTKKAAKEIRERIAELAGQPTEGMFVGTIHGLAKHVLTRVPGAGGTRIDAIAEPGSRRYQALERMLDDVLRADASLNEALAVRARAYVRIPPNDGKHGEKVRVSLRTGAIDVRSHGEAAICRVLDEREIPFEYEAACVEAPASEEERKRQPEAAKVKAECLESGYRPDFKITLAEGTVVWLEHWGVDGEGNPPKGWDEEDRRRYVEGMQWKRRTHEVLGTRLAETDWGQYAEVLRGERNWDSTVVEAIARAAGQDPASIDERFPRKDDGWKPEAETIRILVQEVSEWIGAAGRCGLEEADIERRIEGMDGVSARDEAQALATLAKAVRRRYEAHLEDAGTTDFEKMVLDAARALEAGKVRPGFDMVIVDEWQDVNGAQERFVRALSRHGGKAGERPTLCVVGDDWQSIYGFQGGDPEYTRSFAKKGDACERTDLDRTWRFGKRRAHATRKWALGDADAVDKQVEGNEKKDGAGAVNEIVGRTITAAGAERLGGPAGEESAETAIRGILEKIGEKERDKERDKEQGPDVLLLARRRNTVADSNRPEDEEARKVIEEWRTQPWRIPSGVDEHDAEEVRAAAWERARQRKAEGLDHQALQAAARRAGVALDLETMTVHGAKGLEADYVIFVQGRDRKVKDELREKARERALQPLLPAGANGPEEERRVWYVALTRAKLGTYVVEPPGDAGDTALLDELWRDEKREYGVGEAELAEWLAPQGNRI